ncbi:MAG: peptide deformylase [Gammaproteobacteria bacterium]|jgi:peptide deformylase|nr:peptide deformylase [Gammaproteobacteria bacterium]
MSKLEVLHFPDPRLRKKAIPIEIIDSNITTIAENMLETMYDEAGIGLAATQVNIQKRIIVIDVSEERDQPRVLINPKIVSSEGIEQMQEGCLSVPGYYDDIERAEKIKYSYLTEEGELIEEDADGLLSVCIQHEIDHLDGKLFIDYLSPLKRQRLLKKIDKQERAQAL